ncbi:uncharacterized protein K460DRAFT_399680 [Cucurbitaria berberidis CBS 394.84]|uniref:WD-like domain-containing protein n=1 Tax=Cucurbitaria berberidis CBS 394.84 TaxID=1168544 RepID=A0A9P4LBG2_9PLEO|nr:uncharacterized protein K460DRAFT_399680 [Cucurbitaria berberidis CBS 394.84]KAF1849561.1 hypothetical protein K460DRAFT_399680 [Cucurbitaria berberidis CBS 394.84]
MQFSTVTLLMASLMATGLMASPTAGPDETSVYELKSEKREGGSIVQYGEVKRSLAPRKDCGGWFQPPCPPKTCHETALDKPECDGKKNGGTNSVCSELINDLYGNKDTELVKGAQQICWKNDATGKTGCCIKWTKAVPGLKKNDLIERGDKIKSTCDTNGISGKYNTVNLKGVCLSYCMSIGAGCKDESDFS